MLSPVMISEKWYEIDTPQDLDFARKIFKNLNHRWLHLEINQLL